MSIEVAAIENDLGMTFRYAGRFDDAERAYRRVQEIIEEQHPVDPSDLATLYHNLGGLAHARGDHAAAEPLARRAVEIRSIAAGPRAVSTLLDRSAYVAILAGLGRFDDAETEIRDVLPGLVEALGDGDVEVAVARSNLAAIVQRRGDLAQAEALYRKALAAREAFAGLDSSTLAIPLSNLATVLRMQGRRQEARALLERAVLVLKDAVRPDHPALRAILRNLDRVAGPHSPALPPGPVALAGATPGVDLTMT
jgi:Flp pilus assembly protein TadD